MSGGSRRASVLVVSTRAAVGAYADETGPVIAAWLRERGFSLADGEPRVVADADVSAGLATALADLAGSAHSAGTAGFAAVQEDARRPEPGAAQPALLITTGGTGAAPDDRTPEATAAFIDRPLPGIAEEIRRRGTEKVPTAILSRGVAGLAGRTVIVNLPGSRGGVRDGLAVLDEVLDHLLDQLAGGDH